MGIGAVAGLGVFQIGIASTLLSYGVRHVTALQSLLTSILEPLLNPVWVFLVVGERPAPLALVGGAIILVTISGRSLMTIISERREAKPRAATA